KAVRVARAGRPREADRVARRPGPSAVSKRAAGPRCAAPSPVSVTTPASKVVSGRPVSSHRTTRAAGPAREGRRTAARMVSRIVRLPRTSATTRCASVAARERRLLSRGRTDSPRTLFQNEALYGPANGAIAVEQSAFGDTDARRLDTGMGVQADPLAARV